MQDTRDRIVAALDATFKQILQANGYRTDLGAAVYPWLKYRSSNGGEPIVFTYRDPRRLAGNVGGEERSLGEENFLLDIELQAIVEADDEETTVAHNIIKDLRQALGADPTFGQVANWTAWISDEIETEVGHSITSFVNVVIQVFYTALDWTE